MTNPLVLAATYNKRSLKLTPDGAVDPDKLTRELGNIESALKFATSLAATVGNVVDFGADARGVHDASAAFQRAVDACAVVLVPVGTFRIDTPVRVTTRTVIRIEGTIALTGYLYGANPPTVFEVTADATILTGTGTLRGPGLFSHDTVTDTAYIPSLIRVTGADDVKIAGLTFVDVPQAGIVYTDADDLRIVGNTFVGGDTVAACVAGINYYAIAGYSSDTGRIIGNTFTADADGNTFAEGVFCYGTNHTMIAENTAHNIVDHDVYLYHSVGDITGVNNYNVITDNISTTTLTAVTQKVGASYKVHGVYNQITGNNSSNTLSHVVLEGGAYSTITGNTMVGHTQQAIIVSDLVAPNALGLRDITVEGNTIHGAATGTPGGVYFRGDPVFSTANAVSGRIVGNTITRCVTPIELYHSLAPYVMTGFTVTDNTIDGQTGAYGVYCDRVESSTIGDNTITDGTYTNWRGIQLVDNVADLTIRDNTIADAGSALAYGLVLAAGDQTTLRVTGNVVRNASIYGAVFLSPLATMAAYRDNDWGSVANEPIPPTVASAASVTLPVGWDIVAVSGTTNITSITAAGQSNHRVTLVFAGALSVVDGSNLVLNGSYTTSTDATLTLVCDGTDWYEVARSVPTGGGGVTVTAASIVFTDGDTARRTTIADASITSTSKILLSITRPTVTAEDDVGLLYTSNVVSRGAGTFDVFTICTDMSGNDPVESPPNETITLYYTVAT